jgi:hypothetical protein
MSEHRKKWIMRFLAAFGILTLLFYFEWWFEAGGIFNPWLAIAFVFGILCALPQLVGTWYLYLKVRPLRVPTLPVNKLSVDVFVTACKEPLPLVRKALEAACAMRGRHKTWLLDDGSDPRLASLTRQVGAGYLIREGCRYAKAGNLNAALARTSGQVIAIFDVDHVPEASFLERTLGFFSDPKVGFVQVMLTFRNSAQSWVARAANETSLDYYNPTSRGAEGLKGATLTGSNALIRRSALTSIGGYQPGLAEDLATSIALHSAGWSSVYVNEPLAPGLAPHDLTAWFTQQLKWARGVFEILLAVYPRLWKKLTWGQRASYAVRMTYYWIGPVVGAHILELQRLPAAVVPGGLRGRPDPAGGPRELAAPLRETQFSLAPGDFDFRHLAGVYAGLDHGPPAPPPGLPTYSQMLEPVYQPAVAAGANLQHPGPRRRYFICNPPGAYLVPAGLVLCGCPGAAANPDPFPVALCGPVSRDRWGSFRGDI